MKPPCIGCKYQFDDKEPVDSECANCNKRILYDYSLIDPRLIPDYILEDIERLKNINKEAWETMDDPIYGEKKVIAFPSWKIDDMLSKFAKQDGFNDFVDWLKYLNKEKKIPVQEISNIYGINYGSIRNRLSGKYIKKYENEKENNEYESRFCLYCGKILIRKLYKNNSYELKERFLNRKFCSRKCSSDYRSKSKIIKLKPKFCLYCNKELIKKETDKIWNYRKKKFCNQSCNAKYKALKMKKEKGK